MEDVIIKNIDLGDKPPLIHRVSQPMLDERGIWLDMDVTYEGLCHITVTTKLNLLRLKRPARSSTYMQDSNFNLSAAQMNSAQYTTLLNSDMAAGTSSGGGGGVIAGAVGSTSSAAAGSGVSGRCPDDELFTFDDAISGSAIFDSDAESTGSSSTESDGSITGQLGDNPNSVTEG